MREATPVPSGDALCHEPDALAFLLDGLSEMSELAVSAEPGEAAKDTAVCDITMAIPIEYDPVDDEVVLPPRLPTGIRRAVRSASQFEKVDLVTGDVVRFMPLSVVDLCGARHMGMAARSRRGEYA